MHRFRRGAALTAALTLAVFLAACSSSSKSGTASSTTSPPAAATSTTGAASAASRAPYAGPGPDAVGFTTLQLAGGRKVVVWYPATKGATAGRTRESIDIASYLSPALQAKIPAADRVLYSADAFEDAPARGQAGGYPVVLFSHGFAGFPEQSVTLTTHLASWGFVVAAPDHVERSLDGLLGTAAQGVPKQTDVQVLGATLDLVEAQSKAPGLLHGLADPSRVAVTGHSAGASAAYEDAAADPRIKAWISYAVSFTPDNSSSNAQTIPPAPDKPGMVMLGTTDTIIPAAQSEKVYAAMKAPKYLVKIADAGHLVFSDLCLIGSAKGGIVNIAKVLKLPIPPSLLKLGSDGCNAPHPLTSKAFPAIDQLSVAFLRSALHLDATPRGLSTAAVAGLGADVTVQHN